MDLILVSIVRYLVAGVIGFGLNVILSQHKMNKILDEIQDLHKSVAGLQASNKSIDDLQTRVFSNEVRLSDIEARLNIDEKKIDYNSQS